MTASILDLLEADFEGRGSFDTPRGKGKTDASFCKIRNVRRDVLLKFLLLATSSGENININLQASYCKEIMHYRIRSMRTDIPLQILTASDI